MLHYHVGRMLMPELQLHHHCLHSGISEIVENFVIEAFTTRHIYSCSVGILGMILLFNSREISILEYLNFTISPYYNISILQYLKITISQYSNISIIQYIQYPYSNLSIFQYLNILRAQ